MSWTKEDVATPNWVKEVNKAEAFVPESNNVENWTEEGLFFCTVSSSSFTNGQTLHWPYASAVITITFNKDTVNFIQSDISTSNCSITDFTAVSGTVYTVTISFASSLNGAFSLTVPANVCTDAANITNKGIKTISGTYSITLFESTWIPTLDSGSYKVTIPTYDAGGTFSNFTIDWGDGSTSDITSYNDADLTHTYTGDFNTSADKTIKFDGEVKVLKVTGAQETKLKTISNWGQVHITTTNMFEDCANLQITASNAPNVSTTSLLRTFYNCVNITGIGTGWDVSNVTNMGLMFGGAALFNGSDLVNWDTSSVTNMNNLFYYATSFNQDLNNWNVAAVTNFSGMFRRAQSFNQDLSNWTFKSSGTITMDYMFEHAHALNSPLNWSGTKLSRVTNIKAIFAGCAIFNQDIGSWRTTNCTDMGDIFDGATAFNNGGNDNIKYWDTSSATNMAGMFYEASSFNQSIDNWDTADVTSMNSMFFSASAFNQDISSWNITSLTNATFMLQNANAWSNSYYDALLIAWEGQSEQPNVTFHAGDAVMTTGGAAEAARNALVANGWTITDSAGTHT
tara:strand:+ start:1093 stop:2796 length:1704 start_codon:yes stop_codon:yes gene_type:complete